MGTLTQEALERILEDLSDRYWRNSSEDTVVSFRDRVLRRRRLFHNQEPTKMKGRLANMTPFESDLPRQRWSELRSRITENHIKVRVRPIRDSATQRNAANETEAAIMAGIEEVEQRNGFMIQTALADAQIIDGVGVLHWRKADEMYPDYPLAEQIVDLPDDPDERKRYSNRRKGGSYVETPESVRERRAYECAKAGFPWIIEVPDVLACLWDEDDFGLNFFAYIQNIPLLTYAREAAGDDEVTSVNDADPDQMMLHSRPVVPEMSSVDPADMVQVVTVWTRTHWYEMYRDGVWAGNTLPAGWKLVEVQEHDYEDVPFAIVPAMKIENRAPADSYMSALEGLYRLKPMVDRSVSLMLGLQEQAAVKMFYLRRVADGEAMIGEDGARIELDSEAASAMKIPDGYALEEITNDVSPAFMTAVEFIQNEYREAAPKTGRMEISGSTSPWTVKLGLEMENQEPRQYVFAQLRAFQRMIRQMAKKMSKEEEPTYVFARVSKGHVDMRQVLAVEPKLIQSLDIDVDIDPTSAAENVSMVEHGSALLERGLIYEMDFYENYLKKENPDKYYAKKVSFQHFRDNVQPQLLAMEVAKLLAPMVALGPNGSFVGPGGAEVPPEQVLQQNGVPAMPPPPAPFAPAMGGPQGGGANAPSIPPMPALNAPGSFDMPVPGFGP